MWKKYIKDDNDNKVLTCMKVLYRQQLLNTFEIEIDPYIFFYQDYNVHVLVIELFV